MLLFSTEKTEFPFLVFPYFPVMPRAATSQEGPVPGDGLNVMESEVSPLGGTNCPKCSRRTLSLNCVICTIWKMNLGSVQRSLDNPPPPPCCQHLCSALTNPQFESIFWIQCTGCDWLSATETKHSGTQEKTWYTKRDPNSNFRSCSGLNRVLWFGLLVKTQERRLQTLLCS